MNIEGLPFAHSDYAFLVSVAFMLATIAVMLGFFRLRRLI
jgi:Mg2+ and Co2+ transporter CorA